MTIALLIGSVVLAVFTVLWVKPTNRNRLKLLIAFSGSYLLSITALHLLPEVFASSGRGAYFGAFILVGFFLQVMLEYLSGGIEHGHEVAVRHCMMCGSRYLLSWEFAGGVSVHTRAIARGIFCRFRGCK